MLYTKEFYEIMDFFENKASKEIYIGGALTREDKEQWKRGCYYTNGNANNFSKCF